MEKNKYKISVVIPVYNVEEYLEETIKSVVDQTIGFENNVQMILINDGSPDNSEAICLKYKEKYPDNIIYIKQKNQGVSAARNNGKKYINAKYVCFLDSDDKWEKHAFERIYNFFEKHYNTIDIVDCRVRHFDGDDSYYIYDKRYGSTRIVNANKEYSLTLLNTATTFLKASAIKDITFDDRLKYSEDTKFINEVLLKKCKYGIKHDALYLYRKRQKGNSAVDKRLQEKAYFLGPPNFCFKDLINLSIKKYGKVTNFLQYLLVSNVLWRMRITEVESVLTSSEQAKYLNLIVNMLKHVDDSMIIDRDTSLNNMVYLLSLKYKKNVWDEMILTDKTISFRGYSKKTNDIFKNTVFNRIRLENNKLIIHGRINPFCTNDEFEYWIEDIKTNKKYYPEIQVEKKWCTYSFKNDLIYKEYLFRYEIPIDDKEQVFESFISLKDKGVFKLDLRLKKSFGLSPNYKSYTVIDRKVILSRTEKSLKVEKYNFINYLKKLFICDCDLLKKLKLKTLIKIIYNPLKKGVTMIVGSLRLKNIIILESNPAFSDSTKEVFDKLIEKKVNDKYKIVWFVDNVEPFKDVHIKNVEFIKYFDPGNPRFKKSKYALYCHKHAKIIMDNNRYIQKKNPKQVRIHLVHGSPIKNAIEYNLSMGDTDYVVTQSKFFAPMDSKVRDIDIDKIKPLGFARDDIIYNCKDFKFDKIDQFKDKKKILWLPTYRNHKIIGNKKSGLKYGLACIDNEKELLALNDKLKKRDVILMIKFHPAENTSIIENFNLSNVIILKDEELKKANIVLYQLFSKVDALITDYSSVYFDFGLTKKNVGLAISDIDDYIKNQGDFQYDYKDIVVGNYMYSNDDLLQFIDDVATDKDRTYKKRTETIKRYDDYGDGKAADRIYDLLKKFL